MLTWERFSITFNSMKKQAYTIKQDKSGSRFVVLSNGNVIPADIAALTAGADKWLSEIECKCRDCGAQFPLRELVGAGQWCEDCAGAEIE